MMREAVAAGGSRGTGGPTLAGQSRIAESAAPGSGNIRGGLQSERPCIPPQR